MPERQTRCRPFEDVPAALAERGPRTMRANHRQCKQAEDQLKKHYTHYTCSVFLGKRHRLGGPRFCQEMKGL